MLVKEGSEGLKPDSDIGTGKAKSKQEVWLSQIIARLNELFITDGLTEKDMINYAMTIRDKVSENERVMHQVANNSTGSRQKPEAMPGQPSSAKGSR